MSTYNQFVLESLSIPCITGTSYICIYIYIYIYIIYYLILSASSVIIILFHDLFNILFLISQLKINNEAEFI
jgi:preprotein translocase subunit SecF